MKTVKKLLALTLAMLMVFALAANASAADAYPKKDIYVVCPWGAGGGTDACLRALCQAMGEELGVNLTVDNLTGGGEGDDEQIMVDLPGIPAEIDKLVFVVNIYDAGVRGQHFGMIKNAFIRIVDTTSKTELCRFNLTEEYGGMQGLVVGELYRYNNEWKFNAVGQGIRDASRLMSIIKMYT